MYINGEFLPFKDEPFTEDTTQPVEDEQFDKWLEQVRET